MDDWNRSCSKYTNSCCVTAVTNHIALLDSTTSSVYRIGIFWWPKTAAVERERLTSAELAGPRAKTLQHLIYPFFLLTSEWIWVTDSSRRYILPSWDIYFLLIQIWSLGARLRWSRCAVHRIPKVNLGIMNYRYPVVNTLIPWVNKRRNMLFLITGFTLW